MPMIDIVRREFTPPAPIHEDEDAFAHIFRTKSYLDGTWRQGQPDYIEIRFGAQVKFQLLTDPRMSKHGIFHDRKPLNHLFGIPIIEDPRMPDGVYTITYLPPAGAR